MYLSLPLSLALSLALSLCSRVSWERSVDINTMFMCSLCVVSGRRSPDFAATGLPHSREIAPP